MKVLFPLSLTIGFLVLGLMFSTPLSTPAAEELQTVIVVLKDQPQAELAAQIWAEKQQQLEAASAELRQAHPLSQWRQRNPRPLTRQEENALTRKFSQQTLDQPTLALLQEKAEQVETIRQSAQEEIYQRSLSLLQESQKAVVEQVEAMGGETLYQYTLWNALAVRIPAERLTELRALEAVAEIYEDEALEPLLNVSVPTLGAPAFWNAGYTGQGVDVAVLDTGIDASHPALTGKVLAQRSCAQGDPNPDDFHGHGTHIGGIIASQDPTHRGVAYGLRTLLNAKASTVGNMYLTDAMSCAEWAAIGNPYKAEVVNFSFGSCGEFFEDTPFARYWDALIAQMNLVATIAAGNKGSAPSTICSPAIAPNAITVANVDDRNTFGPNTPGRTDDSIWHTSSRGPTLGGRKKPDLAAPGTSIISANNAWEGSNPDMRSMSGTSMAAPHVAGAAALLISRGVSDPLAVKALLINTAEDKGAPGWDSAYGWGYIDLNNALFHVEDVYVGEVGEAPEVRFYAGPALSGDTATLVWNRRVPYSSTTEPTTAYTLSNLDLFAYREADNTLITSSLSTVDNVEQVKFPANESKAVLAVRAVGDIVGAESEKFALAVPEGFTPHAGPYLSVFASLQGDLHGQTGAVISLTLTVKNIGDLKAFNNSLSILPSANLTPLSSSPLTEALPDLSPGESYALDLTWTFQKQNEEEATLNFAAHSYSYATHFTFLGFIPYYKLYFPLFFR
ncbi:MAG: S8 family serine peptidase [Anaerolineales bacterium]|nr:S8 family serine peptidase [Anaerolineales bacterium]MDW8446761.1 S8 family serine peptidase [Anaerolineales bacterium]